MALRTSGCSAPSRTRRAKSASCKQRAAICLVVSAIGVFSSSPVDLDEHGDRNHRTPSNLLGPLHRDADMEPLPPPLVASSERTLPGSARSAFPTTLTEVLRVTWGSCSPPFV